MNQVVLIKCQGRVSLKSILSLLPVDGVKKFLMSSCGFEKSFLVRIILYKTLLTIPENYQLLKNAPASCSVVEDHEF